VQSLSEESPLGNNRTCYCKSSGLDIPERGGIAGKTFVSKKENWIKKGKCNLYFIARLKGEINHMCFETGRRKTRVPFRGMSLRKSATKQLRGEGGSEASNKIKKEESHQ